MPDDIDREDIVTAMAEGGTAAALFSFAASARSNGWLIRTLGP